MKFRFLIILVLAVFSTGVLCAKKPSKNTNDKDLVLVVNATSNNTKNAVDIALRTALEQAYGVFVSSVTKVSNNKLIIDEIATVTSGNIHTYEILSEDHLPSGKVYVNVKVNISSNAMISFAQSKGKTCSFDGDAYSTNIRLAKLNEQNANKAYKNMMTQLRAIAPYMFDYKLDVKEESISNGKSSFVFKCELFTNKNTILFENIIINTVKGLETSQYYALAAHNMRLDISRVGLIQYLNIYFNDGTSYYKYPKSSYPGAIEIDAKEYYDIFTLGKFPYDEIMDLIYTQINSIQITDNRGKKFSFPKYTPPIIDSDFSSETSCIGKFRSFENIYAGIGIHQIGTSKLVMPYLGIRRRRFGNFLNKIVKLGADNKNKTDLSRQKIIEKDGTKYHKQVVFFPHCKHTFTTDEISEITEFKITHSSKKPFAFQPFQDIN